MKPVYGIKKYKHERNKKYIKTVVVITITGDSSLQEMVKLNIAQL